MSTISITLTLVINYQITQKYLKASGKTKALFGITELIQFGHQYYVVSVGLLAASLAIYGSSITTSKKYFAVLLSTIAIILVFLQIWKIFVLFI